MPRFVSMSLVPSARADIVSALSSLASERVRVSTSSVDRVTYSRDASALGLLATRAKAIPRPPDAVVWPRNEAAVLEVVRWAHEHGFPLIPFGNGTGTSAGTWAARGGIVVDLKHLDAIGEVHAFHRTISVGAGVITETLERTLNAQGFTLGRQARELGTSTVGGWLATRRCAHDSLAHGPLEAQVVSLRAITGAGEVLAIDRLVGPDLAPLLLGSEGTLCLFTEARLRVHRMPAFRTPHSFEFKSLETGLNCMQQLLNEGLQPALMTLEDPLETARAAPSLSIWKPRPSAPTFRGRLSQSLLPNLIEAVSRETIGRPALLNQMQKLFSKSVLHLVFEGTENRTETSDRNATEICLKAGAVDLSERPAREFLERHRTERYRVSELLHVGTCLDFMSVSAPWAQAEKIRQRVMGAAADFAVVSCRVSAVTVDTCALRFVFMVAGNDAAELRERFEILWTRALHAALEAGATVSHQQPIGLLKAPAYQQHLAEARHPLRALKALFDPAHILNPGVLGL